MWRAPAGEDGNVAETKRTDAAEGDASSPSAAGATASGPNGSADRSTDAPSVCPVAFCPICTAVSAMNRSSPDVVSHLLVAGQEFFMALKAFVDARAAEFDAAEDDPPMQRIDIG